MPKDIFHIHIVSFLTFRINCSSDFRGEIENYTFLETLQHKQPEKQCWHLRQVEYGRHLGSNEMATVKNIFSDILPSIVITESYFHSQTTVFGIPKEY